MKKIIAVLMTCSYVVSQPVFADSNINQEKLVRNERPVTTIASALQASNKPTAIPSGSISVETPIRKASLATPTITSGYTSVSTGSQTRSSAIVARSVSNNATVTATQNNQATAVSTQSKPASSVGTQSFSGSGLPQAPAPATSPTIKITGIKPVTQGIQVSIQVSAEVTAVDILYSSSVIGPWTIVDTVEIPLLTQPQMIEWIDDGKKTGANPTKNPSGFYNVKIHTGSITKPPVVSNISIPEQGLTIDTPYYVVTYKVTDEKGVTQDKSAAYDLKLGANEIVIREKNQTGQETVIKRTVQYQTPEDALTEAQKAFRQTVINDNARFFTGVGIDSTTGFPLDYIGTNAPSGGTPWTQPTSIGFYLQLLGDIITRKITVNGITSDQALEAASKTLTNLRTAQLRHGWFGLLPWLKVRPLAADRSQIVFLDNINLSQSVATMLGALEKSNLQNGAAKNIYDLGSQFLVSQKQGYQNLYDKSVGKIYSYYDRATSRYSVFEHADRLGNEVRSGVAFAVAYFGIPKAAWSNLEIVTRNYVTSNKQTVTTVAPYDGGAFQVFWNMLRAPENEITKMKPVLWNAFVAYVDNMQSQNLPGFLSASSLPGGGYDGKIGIQDIAETVDTLRDNVGSLYALGAAYLLDPAKVLSLIESVKKKFPQLMGPNGFYDAASPAGVISQNYYAIDQGSLVLGLSGNGPSSMKIFLQNRNLLGIFTDLYQGLNLNIKEASHVIPEPPVIVTPPVTSTGAVENFDGKSIVASITGSDNVYTLTPKSNLGTNNSGALQVDYKKKPGFPYSFMSIQTKPGTLNFSQYTSFRFQFKKLSSGPMSFILKFESSSGAPIEKTFSIPASATGWQEIVYSLPTNASVLKQATKILLFADGGKDNTSGSFLIDDIEFRKG